MKILCKCYILFSIVLLSSAAAIKNSQDYNDKLHTPTHSQSKNAQTVAKTHYNGGSDKAEKVLRNEKQIKADGSYNYHYEISNGISASEQGVGGQSIQGSSSYVSPEGVEIKLSYTADENGYHPVGDHIPKIPDYVQRAMEYIRAHPYPIIKYYN